MYLTVSEDGKEFLIHVQREEFVNLDGLPEITGARLSDRQREVMVMALRGQCNKDIAKALRITVRTVKFHMGQILQKFGATNRIDLANTIKEMRK